MKLIVNAFLGKLNWGKRACTVFALCAATAVALPAQTFTTLFSFDGADGEAPEEAALVQGTSGDLYGTTVLGGANSDSTVFKISPSGTLTSLYSFNNGTGGPTFPTALIQAANGDFYGTTLAGGVYGYGSVFKITPGGTLTTLYSFCSQGGSNCTDGASPQAGLVQATNGDLYGTTYIGGASLLGSDGYGGTVFKITPGGTLTTLYSFCSQGGSNCTDGDNPIAGLVQATNGDLYGTTQYGGANCVLEYGCGTVFKITLSGALTTLYNFCSQSGCTDGENPYAGLVQATNGDLYGTVESGGTNGFGTVFKITPGGTFTTIYRFCSLTNCADGGVPFAGLVQATNGDLYGTTYMGGANYDGGTIFQITPSGTLTTIYSFCAQGVFPNCPDGVGSSGLIQDTNGTLYGAAGGGTYGYGTIFSLSIGLGPFVETQTTAGKVGAHVKILGTDLTGATSVSFNGTAAAFTVDSPSLITTTVPSGATTGKVEVVTPSGTLSTYVPYRVRP